MKSSPRRKTADLGEKLTEGVHWPVGIFSSGANFFPRRVLVVDDQPLIRWSVSETLVATGHEVKLAADGSAALAAVADAGTPFDVVVLDMLLPDVRDLSLLDRLRLQLPGAVLILMTALGTPDIIRDAEALGATVLHKPFELDTLKQLVQEPKGGTA